MNNEPAFPSGAMTPDGLHTKEAIHEGLTIRDYFAAKAMQGMIAAHENGDREYVSVVLSEGLPHSDGWRCLIAVASYAMADAMMAAREAK